MMPRTVVLIHGLWMTPLSWQGWADQLRSQGFDVVTPTWPRMNHTIEELRADPSLVGGLGLEEIIDAHAAVVARQATKPIIIGHSIGGLVTQVLLNRGLGAAGVAVHPAQTKGVFILPPQQLRAAFPAIGNPLNLNKGIALTPRQFHYAFANALTREESDAAWEKFHVPAPVRTLFQTAFANVRAGGPTAVDYDLAGRPPLLFVAGGADRIVPSSVVRANRKLYRSGRVDLIEFPGRSHFTVGEPGWQDVLGTAMAWVKDKVS